MTEQHVKSLPLSSDLTDPKQNIAWYLEHRLSHYPNDPVISAMGPSGWEPTTVAEFHDEARRLARGLIASGLEVGECLAILGPTSREWLLLDIACAFAGVVTVPIYQTDSDAQIRWIYEDAGIVYAAGDTQKTVDRLVALGEGRLRGTIELSKKGLAELAERGKDVSEDEFNARAAQLDADTLLTMIYTSGTTGRPKGVELTQGNFARTCVAIEGWNPDLVFDPDSSCIMFLPLSHAMARIISYLALGTRIRMAMVPNTRTLVENMESYQPSVFVVVPRVLEKVYNSAEAKAGQSIGGQIFRWAARIARQNARTIREGKHPSPLQRARNAAAERLVWSKVRDALGGSAHSVLSAGAPLSRELNDFFYGIGIEIIEVYGLSELSGPATMTNPKDPNQQGTQGRAIPGTRAEIAEDGEILLKGPGVMRAYHNSPEATAEALADGWFHTGDLGKADENGNLVIVGRKKDIIVTAGGKNVAPEQMQGKLNATPLIDESVVIGDRKPFISALITLDQEVLPEWLAAHNLPEMTAAEAGENPVVLAAIQEAVDDANSEVSRAESIRKFEVLPDSFSIEDGTLTASMKVRRNVIVEKYKDVIDRIYAGK